MPIFIVYIIENVFNWNDEYIVKKLRKHISECVCEAYFAYFDLKIKDIGKLLIVCEMWTNILDSGWSGREVEWSLVSLWSGDTKKTSSLLLFSFSTFKTY